MKGLNLIENSDTNSKENQSFQRTKTISRLNQLDIPGYGDVQKANDHGKANMLNKFDAKNIKNLKGKKNFFNLNSIISKKI